MGLFGFFGFLGFLGFLGLLGFLGFMGLFGFFGFLEFLGLLGFLGFFGFLGLLGFLGFFGFVGFLGFSLGFLGTLGFLVSLTCLASSDSLTFRTEEEFLTASPHTRPKNSQLDHGPISFKAEEKKDDGWIGFGGTRRRELTLSEGSQGGLIRPSPPYKALRAL